MRVAANLTMMYTEVPLLSRYARAAADGFKLVEVSLPYSDKAEDLKTAADYNGVKHVLINAVPGNWEGGQRGIASLASEQSTFSESISTTIHYAKTLDCKKVHVMAGIPSGSDISSAAKVFLENIRYAAETLHENGLECMIEPISRHAIAGYHLNSYEQAREILSAINTPNLFIQFDLFHASQLDEVVTPSEVEQWMDLIGHIQVAQVPSRGEPDTEGRVDYGMWLEWMKNSGRDWVIGCEYKPVTKSVDWVKKYGLQF
ncbi:hypothetical protein PENTCL1PPCAC_6248 [Pristionchus entomophagus]|uniref:Putative hydroxypyruvate isomerase n=1 Tax=Pristionchus entomophagus TaxID=358040 RepID=A0AAV5STZ3_9BILA|nr:hypothetical protein PENTCL1PPCAC_6248 [Pristionchus entomophagus]